MRASQRVQIDRPRARMVDSDLTVNPDRAGSPASSSAARARADGRISPVAWRAADGLEYRDWLLEGRRIGVLSRGSQWWVGDWLLYGTGRWGEMYAAAAKATGYDPKSLRNYRYVASRVSASLRKDNLTFGHHALVASLDADSQRHWLDRAVHDRLSVEDLRGELRAERVGLAEPAEGVAIHPHAGIVVKCPRCGDAVPVPEAVLGRSHAPTRKEEACVSGHRQALG
jgi:hypothetical protein